MTHQQEEQKEIEYKGLYYLVGLLTGMFIAVVTNSGIGYIVSLGVVGLLFAALFINVFVRGREQR